MCDRIGLQQYHKHINHEIKSRGQCMYLYVCMRVCVGAYAFH